MTKTLFCSVCARETEHAVSINKNGEFLCACTTERTQAEVEALLEKRIAVEGEEALTESITKNGGWESLKRCDRVLHFPVGTEGMEAFAPKAVPRKTGAELLAALANK